MTSTKPARYGSARASRAFLAAGVVAIALYFLLPGEGLPQTFLYMAIHAFGVVGLAVGIRINRPDRKLAWRILLMRQVVYFVANVLWYVVPIVQQRPLGFPSWADPLFVAAYLSMAAGVMLFIRERSGTRNRADLVDAGIIALGLTIVFWVFQVQRTFDLSGLGLLAKTFTISYPLIDLILVALLVRLIVGGGTRGFAFWCVFGAVVAQLIADIGYAEAVLQGTFRYGAPHFAGWLLCYLLLGTAALDPSMRHLTDPATDRRRTTLRRRLPVLTFAALVGPVIILVEEQRNADFNLPLVVILTSVIFLLVLSRVSDLMVDLAEYQAVQEQLSRLALIVEASEDGIIGWDADGIITSWNVGAVHLYGYQAEEMLGRPLSFLIPAHRVEEQTDVTTRFLRGERMGRSRPSGSARTARWSTCR